MWVMAVASSGAIERISILGDCFSAAIGIVLVNEQRV